MGERGFLPPQRIQRMLEKNAEKRPSVRDLLADPYVQALPLGFVNPAEKCSLVSLDSVSRANKAAGDTASFAVCRLVLTARGS